MSRDLTYSYKNMNDSQSATADIVKSTAVAGETEEHELFLGQFIAKDFVSLK